MSAAPPDLAALQRTAAAQALAGNQAAFARFVGWDKAHVTRLKQRGQVILRADGQVDFAASLGSIIGNADPARDTVRQQAAERRSAAPPAPPMDDRPADQPGEPDASDTMAYASARARKEHWQAESARIEYLRQIGEVVPIADVMAAIEDASAVFRGALENTPHRVAPELVGKGLDEVRAALRGEVQGILGELNAAFTLRLQQAGAE